MLAVCEQTHNNGLELTRSAMASNAALAAQPSVLRTVSHGAGSVINDAAGGFPLRQSSADRGGGFPGRRPCPCRDGASSPSRSSLS